MVRSRCWLVLLFAGLAIGPTSSFADSWPQFRGVNGSGVSKEVAPLPDDIAPDRNVLWSVKMPPGVSSPIVVDGRLYLTADVGDDGLVTIAVDTKDGSTIWQTAAPLGEIESTDKKPAGRLATPTPATDGEHIVVFFGSSGLLCYDTDGNQLWRRKMGPFNDTRGATSSPILVDGKVLLVEDHEDGSFIAAFAVKTGETLWRTERPLFNRSYGTPVVWRQKENRYVVTAGSGLVTAYELETGKPAFYLQGASAVANPTSIVGDNGALYVTSANPGPKREFQPSFAELIEREDDNRDGRLTRDEMPPSLFQSLFAEYDADQSGDLSSAEYASIQRLLGTCTNGMLAVRPGGAGLDRTDTNILWHEKKSVPRTASPIFYDGHLYMINDGGIFVSRDAKTGETVKASRTTARGKFFGSPVLGDGKIYFASDRGEVIVVSALPQWEELSSGQFDGPIYPSPAISDGRIYLRTESRLYCFSVPEKP